MALSNSQYNAVMRGYEERQRLQRRAMEARVWEVYSKIPQIQELDRQLSTRAADCARRVLGGDTRAREHLKEELADLKEENTTKYNAVVDSVNLDEIRERAINQLGMTYAAADQIVEYDNPASDYVKQYENIPENGVLAQSDKNKK